MTRRLRRPLLVAVAAVAVAVALLAHAGGLLERVELGTVDARFALRGERPPHRDLVVVGIDALTFSELAERFPFSRRTFARALDRIADDGARTIVYDVQFTEPSDDPRADNALIRAARRAGNVIFSTTEVGAGGATNVFGGARGQRYARATVANGLLPEDPDGALRRVPYAVDGLRTLAAAAVERAGGRRLPRAALRHPGAWIDYAGPPDHVAQLPFSRVANGRFAAGTFRDRIVVIGAVAPSLQDRHRTAWRGDMMAGPEIHANAIATLLRDRPLRSVGGPLGVLLIVALALAVPLAALRARPLLALGGGALLAGTAPLGAHAAFVAGWIVPVAAPLLGLATSLAGTVLVHWLSATMERGQVRDLFARFVPDQVVTQVLERAHADGSVRLGGERIDATVMFSDLRGFTSFAETRDPADVLDVLNRYLTDMSDEILDHGGTLVAYMGDGIMAVFGAPLPAGDHADRALDAARAMLERLAHFNTWMRAEGHGDGFAMGVGLHSGAVMSGNVGSARRLEYTAIGDTTNTAARLEAMTKDTPYALLVSQATRDRLRQPPTDLEPVGELQVRGRRRAIHLWGLRDGAAQHATPPSLRADSAPGSGA